MSEFGRTHARTTDPGTSHAAAESMEGEAAGQKRRVLDALSEYPWGATSSVLASTAGLTEHQTGRRIPDLRKDGLIRPAVNRDGEVLTRRGSSGRQQTVWTEGRDPELDKPISRCPCCGRSE